MLMEFVYNNIDHSQEKKNFYMILFILFCFISIQAIRKIL